MSDYLCPTGFEIGDLHVEDAIKNLDEKQLRYATYLALASWAGLPILLAQTSREAVAIHHFLSAFVSKYDAAALERALAEKDTPLHYLLEFAVQFYYNGGNYLGFGDKKLIPRVTREQLVALAAPHADLAALLAECVDAMYSEEQSCLNIGFHPSGVTTYYNPAEFTQTEQAAVDAILREKKVRLENTIVFRRSDRYEACRMCIDVDKEGEKVGEYNGLPIYVTKGLHSEVLVKVNKWLELARQNAANETQSQMLERLIKHYQHGDVEDHVAYSELWVKDEDPVVENYHGFIESYRDPSGVRCEFESFVACIDPVESKFLHEFVANSAKILPLLPYPKEYERKSFTPPSFNAINILTFCTSGMPIGINIPNYDEIRLSKGFKNVSLTNVMASRGATREQFPFLGDEHMDAFIRHFKAVLSLNVAAHELYGHGSGDLLKKENVVGKNIPDLLTPGAVVTTYYEENETYQSVFGSVASAFEECRAETTSLHLMFKDEVLDMYGIAPENRAEFKLCSALSMLHAGIKTLTCYAPEVSQWKQAHARARFAILRACLIWGRGAVKVTKNDKEVTIHIDPSKFQGVVDAIENLLKHLNYFKAVRLPEAGAEFFGALTSLDDFWLQVRSIAVDKQTPRGVICGAVVRKSGDNYTLSRIGGEKPTLLDVIHSVIDTTELALA